MISAAVRVNVPVQVTAGEAGVKAQVSVTVGIELFVHVRVQAGEVKASVLVPVLALAEVRVLVTVEVHVRTERGSFPPPFLVVNELAPRSLRTPPSIPPTGFTLLVTPSEVQVNA